MILSQQMAAVHSFELYTCQCTKEHKCPSGRLGCAAEHTFVIATNQKISIFKLKLYHDSLGPWPFVLILDNICYIACAI